MNSVVDAAMAALRQPGQAIADAMANTPDVPGLYSVHASTEGLAQLGLASHKSGAPIYVGLASKSVRKRDTRQHFASSATGGSTVRRSCAALLADDLYLTPVPRGARSPRSKWRLADKAQEACLTEMDAGPPHPDHLALSCSREPRRYRDTHYPRLASADEPLEEPRQVGASATTSGGNGQSGGPHLLTGHGCKTVRPFRHHEHMTVPQEAIQAGLTLADLAARNTAALVADRVRSAKTSRDMSEQINQLTEIINDLLADKALLITLGQQMDEQLVAQKISEDELTFITDTLIPALESLLSSEEVGAETSGAGPLASLDVIKTLLTPDDAATGGVQLQGGHRHAPDRAARGTHPPAGPWHHGVCR